MTRPNFDAVETPLIAGTHLIEASAGTGKTYAIAMLALRFVVELNLSIDQLLIVTFTKAATEELKDRVRTRLLQAKTVLEGGPAGDDNHLINWLQNLEIPPEEIKKRLSLALLDIDQAGIFTIHGFCQRVLTEHALESGQLFDVELTGDIALIKQSVADDFWRKQLYCRTQDEVAILTTRYQTPDALLSSVADIAVSQPVYPEPVEVDALLAAFKQNKAEWLEAALANGRIIQSVLADGYFKKAFTDNFAYYHQSLLDWLQGQSAALPSKEVLNLYHEPTLVEELNGQKLRKTKDKTGEQRKQEYFEQLGLGCAAFAALPDSLQQIGIMFRRQLLELLHKELTKRLQQQNLLSFDDLINRLADALRGEKAELLSQALQQRYQAALIDEFQDTDQNQWSIFARLFDTGQHYLYLIGDPKQAIYKFRGADIYSYFAAQQRAQYQYTLGFNWRSHPDLVQAVNELFAREQAFFQSQPVFEAVKPGLGAEQGELYYQDRPAAPMQLWHLPESETKEGYWTAGQAGEQIQQPLIREILTLLQPQSPYSLREQQSSRSIRPKDIAILVRDNQQARDYQAALRLVGVPSVLNSTESVFASQEAQDLYHVLSAVVHNTNLNQLKQALIIDWFGFNGHQYHQLVHDQQRFDQYLLCFQDYHQLWQAKGLMAMMQALLSAQQVRINLAKSQNAERRLTNLYHLIELLQQAIVDEHLAMHKALDWLQEGVHHALSGRHTGDEQQLRLESDEQAVQIVTMHRSKGLEYNVVFCPFLWARKNRLQSESELIKCHENGQMIADLGSKDFEQRRQQALAEELAEDLRVFYVAVTRAKYRCYLVWADVRSKENTNNSAMNWLLQLSGLDFAAQQAKLQAYQSARPNTFSYCLLETLEQETSGYKPNDDKAVLNLTGLQRSLHSLWQMSSYTALSALSQHDAPELPEDKADERLSDENLTLDDDDGLPKGAHTGNVVHELLEHNDFAELFAGKDIGKQRDALCQRYSLKLADPAKLDRLLINTLATPLAQDDNNFCLKALDSRQCLKEMPFYLSMPMMKTERINRVLVDSPTFQVLTPKQMQGYLTGFIDLICVYQGKYYVMDYKTNSLPDYSEKTLIAAMRSHNYGLQYWIYSLVLHRYLQQRLPDYNYQQHFGGVRYLFVRGMQAGINMSGVYQSKPGQDKLEALSEVLLAED